MVRFKRADLISVAFSVIYADLTLLKWVSLILHPNPACEFTNYFQVTIHEFVRLAFLRLLVHVSFAVSFPSVTLLWLRVTLWYWWTP